MKKKWKLCSFGLLVTLLFVFNFGAVLAAPDSITVKRAEVVSDLVTNKDHGFTIFETTDGKTIYCMDNLKKPLISGQVATKEGNADDGVLYILKNGYPNKAITGTDETDFYITQASIWLYLEETGQGSNLLDDEFKNPTENDVNGLVSDYIRPMVDNAKKYKDTQTKPTVNVSVNGENLALTSDNNYYESELISVTMTGASSYSAIFEGGTANTVIVDESGNVKTVFNAGEKFRVRIPANELTEKTDVNIKVTANGELQVAKIYKTNDESYQRVVGLYNEDVPVSQTLKLVATPGTTSVEVEVPNTSANILMLSIAMGILIVIAGVGIIIYRSKKGHQI